MFIVAIAEVHGDLAREAQPLAEILGVAAYDVKLWLGAALPHVVKQTASREEAESLLFAIRARGHGAVMTDAASISTTDVVHVKRLSIDAVSLGANDLRGDRLLYDSIGALIRIAIRTDVERVTHEKEMSPEGGLTTQRMRTVVRERTSHEHVVDHALFVFPVDGVRPWVISERETRYLGLGAAMRPTAYENFIATVELLRERAQGAAYDERFVASPRTPHKIVRVHGVGAPEYAEDHGDASVYLLALWLMRGRGGPYRDAAPPART